MDYPNNLEIICILTNETWKPVLKSLSSQDFNPIALYNWIASECSLLLSIKKNANTFSKEKKSLLMLFFFLFQWK